MLTYKGNIVGRANYTEADYVKDVSAESQTSYLFEEIKVKGIKFSTWCSDLYVPVTPETTEIMKRRGIYGTVLCTTFRSIRPEDNGALWYEIPFAYPLHYYKNGEK